MFSLFLPVMDIFSVDLKFCHMRSTLYSHVLVGLTTGPLPSTLYSMHFFTQSSSLFLITCPYHLSLPLLMTVVIGSTPTNSLNSSLVLLSFMETPHIHRIICCIFGFLKYTHYVCWWRILISAGGLPSACQYQYSLQKLTRGKLLMKHTYTILNLGCCSLRHLGHGDQVPEIQQIVPGINQRKGHRMWP